MPNPGFKTITIRDDIYDELFTEYERQKTKLGLKGITSFSGYIVWKATK